MIPRQYETVPYPLGGEMSATVLANPTRAEKRAYLEGRALLEFDLDQHQHQADAALADVDRQLADLPDDDPTRAQWEDTRRRWIDVRDALPQLRERRAAFMAVLPVIFARCQIEGLDFRTPDAAFQSLQPRDDLPDELIWWLAEVPVAVWEDREERARSKPRGLGDGAKN